jgi:hypothetical protein
VVLDAEAMAVFFQVGEDFVAAGRGTLATQVTEDVLAAQVQGGVLQEAWIQTAQGLGILDKDIEGKLGLVGDPAVGQAVQEIAEQGIAALGQGIE